MFVPWILALALERSWGTPELFLTIKDPRVTESSGVAASTLRDGVYYTHNDSGDTARFFRFTKSGVDATFDLTGVKAVDWEDMSSIKIGGRSWLYLGDIGDNSKKRPTVSVYRVAEPNGTSRSLTGFQTYTLTYPDGPHDCEALFVDPKTGDLYLVTKDERESAVFRLGSPRKSGAYRLSRIGAIKPDTGLGKYGRLVTAGDVDPDGQHVVIRTYSGALEYTVHGDFKNWWMSKPAPVRMPLDIQGEAVCYVKSGQAVMTTSEGSPCPVHAVPLKK